MRKSNPVRQDSSRRVDALHALRIVHQLKKIRMLRRIRIIDNQFARHLPRHRIEPVTRVTATNAPPPRDHLAPIPILSAQLDHAPHDQKHLFAISLLLLRFAR